MNTQERDQLTTFLQQLGQARAGVKDSEAQTLIDNALARQPDAAYLLVQRCLLQDGALQAAQAQISNLQAELQQARQGSAAGGPGFLDSNAWGWAPAVPSYVAPSPATAPAPGYYQGSPAPLAAAPSRFQAPSFLTSMATTAAGVAAGAFLFQGIESLMGHHGSNDSSASHALGGGSSASAFGLSDPALPALDSVDKNSLVSSDASTDTDSFSGDDGMDFGVGDSSDWA
ncbi:hypothetical protein SAMN05216303_11085 [Rhodoferax sp. OV413]|uniref:DUF2076 domain-containing protein n=1 Tax=Rhodoferax sp. OV413 TaxID=1855285 RepID=UPI00088386FD|nr:DUF2076 domain-containing protein [Rhodoferax sp. OV413]SDP92220.1 hypothetical protein SAMN05216303_11085 [Rhodoferax sp. OV413]